MQKAPRGGARASSYISKTVRGHQRSALLYSAIVFTTCVCLFGRSARAIALAPTFHAESVGPDDCGPLCRRGPPPPYDSVVPHRLPRTGEVRIIGAALPRTGTASLRLSLWCLGYKPVHGGYGHNETAAAIWAAWQEATWRGPEQGGAAFLPALATLQDHGFDVTLDMPYCMAYRELMDRYPRAKVLLTHHPGGLEGWMRSLETGTVHLRDGIDHGPLPFFVKHDMTIFRRDLNCALDEAVTPYAPSLSPTQKEACMRGAARWIAAVRASVPKDRLAEYNVTQGWKPLCDLLGVPVPSLPGSGGALPLPFPHQHDDD